MTDFPVIDGHYLLPHQADWLTRPTLAREWQSGLAQTLAGVEGRSVARQAPWLNLSYDVLPFDNTERMRFENRARQALQAGKAAVPFWSTGAPLSVAATAGADTVTLTRTTHQLVENDWLFVQSGRPAEYLYYDFLPVESVAGAVITLRSALLNSWPAGTRVWKLLFGRLVAKPITYRSTGRGGYTVQVSFDRHQVQTVGYDDFDSYTAGTVTSSLSGGEGFDGPWVFASMS